MQLWWRVNREIHDRYRQVFRELELPPMALMLLRTIVQEPGITVSELARRTGSVKSHVSTTVEQLVRLGYVTKRPDPSDQRLLRIETTQAALDLKAEMEAKAHALWSEILAEVGETEIEEMSRSLRTLLTALEKANGKAGSD